MKRSQKMPHYLLADIHRILHRKETYAAVAGVTAALFFSMEDISNIGESVLYVVLSATYHAGFMLTFVFCALPYATAYSEELESHYMRYLVGRGSLKNYVFSKTVTTFLSAVLVMGAGCMIFAQICSLWLPWMDSITFER